MNIAGYNLATAGLSPPANSTLSLSMQTHLRELSYVRLHPVAGRKANAVHAYQTKPGAVGGGASSSATLASAAMSASASSGASASAAVAVVAAGGGAGLAVGNGAAHLPEGKASDFLYYSDSEDEEVCLEELNSVGNKLSCNFVSCLQYRELGFPALGGGRFFSQRVSSDYGTRHMLANSMLKESTVALPNFNKVFCSKWLSHRQVVFGTKCNKLMVFDVNTRHLDQIPSLQSSENSIPPDPECGIHSIEINPSGTLLATGASNARDVAVYGLPTLDPICVGEGAHTDWIFDMTWLDDQFLVSGSRDGTLALWRITDSILQQVTSSEIPSFVYSSPLTRKLCKTADKVRCMCFNQRRSEIAVVSSNGFIHCWDGLRFRQVMSKKLPHTTENVCLSVDDDAVMYAVGSRTNTDLLDARTLQAIKKIPSKHNGCGIRSVSFKGNILTIGTGLGMLLFWDLRASKFLESTMNSNRAVTLKASRGWIQHDQFINNLDMQQQRYLPAILTHCYDASGTRLFAAGGPLQCSHKGNYMALFQ